MGIDYINYEHYHSNPKGWWVCSKIKNDCTYIKDIPPSELRHLNSANTISNVFINIIYGGHKMDPLYLSNVFMSKYVDVLWELLEERKMAVWDISFSILSYVPEMYYYMYDFLPTRYSLAHRSDSACWCWGPEIWVGGILHNIIEKYEKKTKHAFYDLHPQFFIDYPRQVKHMGLDDSERRELTRCICGYLGEKI